MKKFILLILTVSLTLSCSVDDKITNDPEGQDGVPKSGKSINNMLEFSSFQELESFISERLENEKDLLDDARDMALNQGHYSLLYIYNSDLAELAEVGIQYEDVSIVNSYDDMLHLLLNIDGEVKIEDKTYRIDGEFVFQYTEDTEHLINEFLNEFNSGNIQIEVNEFIEYQDGLLVLRHENDERIEFVFDEVEDVRGVTHHNYFSNCGTAHRMVSRQFNGFYLFYSSIGSSTKVQQRKRFWFFGWRYYWSTVKKYNRLQYNLEYTANSTLGYPPIILGANGHVYCYCNSASKTYNWAAGLPAPLIFSPNSGGNTKHWAHEFSCSPDTVSRTINY